MKWISECKLWVQALLFSLLVLSAYSQSFTEVAASRNAQVGSGSKDGGQAWADLNQDGYLDLVVNTNNTSSYTRVFFWNSGTNQYDDVTATHAPDLLLNVCERSALTGDFDNDGDIDFMRSRASRLEIYENLGALASPAYSFSLKQIIDPAWFTGLGTQSGMNNEGLAWMDFDGDGDLDVYMEDHQYGQDILENDGMGNFTHYTPDGDPKGFPTTGVSGDYSVTADLDDNGDVDIVARREGTSTALRDVDIFTNNSDGTFSPNTSLNLDTRNSFKGGVAVADFDSDGDFDYFWTNHGTSSANVTHVIAEQTGLNSGSFALATVTITPAPSWTGLEIEGIAMGDVNNDGKVDVFLASDSGAGYLLINTTTGGTFSFSHNNAGIDLNADGEGAVFGDYDNDGDLDLYVNIRGGNNQLWENDLGGNTDYLKVEPLIDLGGGISRSATGATVVMELKGCTDLKFIQEVSGGVGHGSQNDPRLHFGLPSGPNTQYKVTVSFVRPNGGGRTIVEKYVTPSALPGQTLQLFDTDVSDPDAHPAPADDNFTVARNSSNNILDVLNNDTDPNAEDLTISLLSGTTAQGGTVTVNDNGTPVDPTDDFVEYTPPASFSGVDIFTYHVTNQSGFCSSADVSATVNSPPVADDNTVATDEDVTYVFGVADFTVNFNDTNGDPFAEIRITRLESVGSLLLGGTPVALNNVITAAQISGGQLTFVPIADQNGSPYDSFDFEVGDGTDFSTLDYSLTINVIPVNDPPTGDNNSVTTDEDIDYTFSEADFMVNFSDPEGDLFAEIRITSLVSTGNLLYNGNPVTLNQVIIAADLAGNLLTFEPLPDENGTPYASFNFEVGDGSLFSQVDYTLTINVNAVDDLPISSDKIVSTPEDTPYIFTVSDFSFSRIRITRLESVGELLLNGNPVVLNQIITITQIAGDQLVFVPQPNQNGSPYDDFDFEVGDNFNFNPTDYTLTINVPSVNDPPTSTNLAQTTDEDTELVLSETQFDAGYYDPDGDPLIEIRITSIPTTGTLMYNGNPVAVNQVISVADIIAGLVTFQPLPGESGSSYDSFDFEVGDGNSFSSTSATFTVNVNSVNDTPLAVDDNGATLEDTPLSIDVMVNDNLGDEPTKISAVDAVTTQGGAAFINNNGTTADTSDDFIDYNPLSGFSGSDTFTYTIEDTDSETSTATITVNVTPVNDPPIADNNTVSTDEDVTYVFTLTDFTINYSDPDGDLFAEIRVTSLESVGSLLLGGSMVALNDVITVAQISGGELTFVPVADQSGSPYDNFDFEVGDGTDFSTSDYTLTINVAPVNDPPTSTNLSTTIDEDDTQVIDPAVLTGGYSDPEGDPLVEIRITNLPTNGTLLYNGNPVTPGQVIPLADMTAGMLAFEPLPDENGTSYDSFDFEVGDGNTFSSSSATFTINVNPVNDTPLAVEDSGATQEETPVSIDVLLNDNLGDEPTQISTIDGVTAQGGTAVINNNGTPADNSDDFIDYDPPSGFIGTDTFTYTIQDTDGETSTATVVIGISMAPSTVVIYKGISPNGDGSNDQWVIDGILFYPDNSVQIFNRWGNLVYKEHGYDNQSKVWFGQSNEGWVVGDNILPDGTYFYMVDLGDGSDVHSGYVMLKR